MYTKWKKAKKFLIGLFVTVFLSTPIIAYAAVKYPKEGGVWKYGRCWSLICAYSEYYHDYNSHSAAVEHVGDGIFKRGEAGAGAWAKAKAYRTPATGFSYYYNVW